MARLFEDNAETQAVPCNDVLAAAGSESKNG